MSSSPLKKPRIDPLSPSSSAESPLIWIQGTGPATTGSVLVKLAQSGYKQESRKIIELSSSASLIGRDSNGGLPELWDVMGTGKGGKGRGGITRLMAVCITRGSLSPVRARDLIRGYKASSVFEKRMYWIMVACQYVYLKFFG